MENPPSFIAPYPVRGQNFLISMKKQEPYELQKYFTAKPQVTRSSFAGHDLTITGAYYKKGSFIYEYTPRTVDADAFLQYRRRSSIESKLSEFSSQALSKEQKNKSGGLLQLTIPIKSRAVESIFGEGGAGLKVSGSHQIIFSGRSQWDDRTVTATYKQSKFPTLNMEQISRFDIRGTIGSKVTVSVSQDSKTEVPLANRIIIRYKGDEDDIIKNIEAGNTTLSLPKTQLVGYTSRIQGLFGIKTEAQIGGLSLTAIASQEKGSTERTSINAGASASKSTIRDWQYYDGKILDLGRATDFQEGDIIDELILYKYTSSSTGAEATGDTARMYVDPLDIENPLYENENSPLIQVEIIDDAGYSLDEKAYTVLFNTPYGGASGGFIGAYMKIKRGDSTITVGDTYASPMILKLIKHQNPNPSMVTWNYVWRNVYYLKSTNLDLAGLEINIFKGLANTEVTGDNPDHQEGVPYIQIFGLDQYDQVGNKKSDGLVDVNSNIIVPGPGLLIFPDRHPFDPSKNFDSTATLETRVPEIYENGYGTVNTQSETKYYIEISNRSRAAELTLGRSNIIENSEQITLNGRQLTKGTDYNINYDFGRITFLDDDALDPNANVSIDYEYAPLFALQKKTLFGIRGEYEFNKNLEVGATFLYKSDKATERKPRIGQETTRTMIWDANTRFSLRPNFITKIANALPFYSSETPSNFAVTAEIAQSYPDPNVDGVAYIDDFEGSRDSYSLGVIREAWHYASKPNHLLESDKRAKLIWYNPYNQLSTQDIWDRDVSGTDSRTHTLWLKFSPSTIDRRLGEYKDAADAITDPITAWGGILRALPQGAWLQDRAQLLELRVNGNKGILHIDMGVISEDLNGNGSGQPDREGALGYGIIDDAEDVGLDGLTDEEERTASGIDLADPFEDNYYYDAENNVNDYSRINGTQNNLSDPGILGRGDTEDINLDGILELDNYFSYRIDLADPESPFLVQNSENEKKWRSFRIPIKDSTAVYDTVGVPDWTNIKFVRIWIDSVSYPICSLGIAALDIVSSNWDDSLIVPSEAATYIDTIFAPSFTVGVVNTQENFDYFPPPGVAGYYDKVNKITEPEQSLLLHFSNFGRYPSIDSNAADTGIAERILFDTPNLMGYKSLKMYVHGPPVSDVDSVRFFFRIGQDQDNFYEYQKTLDTGWAKNEVVFDFNEITGLKEYLLKDKADNPEINEKDSIINGNYYRVLGSPDITQVKYLAAGVVNLDPDNRITGDVWIDELRVTDVRRDVGLALQTSASGNFADLFNYRVNYSYQNPYFQQISTSSRAGSSQNLGSGQSATRYGFGISSIKLDRFLPRAWSASIPVSFSYNKSVTVPRLRSRSDIIIPEEFRDEESTISTSKSFQISESFNKKTKNPLFTVLLNPIKTNFSYSRTDSRSPVTPESMSESYQIGGGYNYSLKSVPNIKPLFWIKPIPLLNKMGETKFFLLPNTLTLRGDFSRRLSISRNSNNVLTNSLSRSFSGRFKVGYKIFENLIANYSMDTKRDLSDPETVILSFNPKKFKFGRETSFSESFGANYSPSLFDFFTHKFSFSTSYRENINVISMVHNASASKNYGVNGKLDLQKLFSSKPRQKSRQSKYRRQKEEREKRAKDAAEKDSTGINNGQDEEQKEEDDGPKRSIFGALWSPFGYSLRLLTGWIDPFTYDYKEGYNYSFPGLAERAKLNFRFGLTDDIGVPISEKASGSFTSNSISKSVSYSLRSGTTLLGGIKAGVTFQRSIRQDIVKAGSRQKSVSTTFPDISFSIRPLKSFTFFNPIIQKFSPRTKYTRSTAESSNLTTGFKISDKVTTSQSPLLAFSVGVMKGMQINIKTDRSVSKDNRYEASKGTLSSTTQSTSSTTTFGTKYSFTWPTGIKIPLLGRLKFNSTMSINLDVSLRSTKTEKSTSGGPLISEGERSDFMVSTTVSYSFSSQIKGGMSGRWQDTDDKKLRRKSHIRELRIWVDIRF